jgi:hypothetical protein
MTQTSITPTIAVAIGRQTRFYHAFVTTAPPEADGPSTVTLYAATLVDVAALAADPVPYESDRAKSPARLVLIESTQLGWHRAKYREGQYLLAVADPGLVGLNTLQSWLWQRFQAFIPTEVYA